MLPLDYDLTASEIQQIANKDALAALFTAMGYETGGRIDQTAEALGFPEALAREVLHAERLAEHEAGALQVYLLEMKRVTVALTQALARAMKSRAGLFFFVLTTRDYEQLDFVLFDPILPEGGKPSRGPNGPQIVLRPRILSVERRNPDRVSLRVLRRFSYTEIDADYQWDKLRSAYGVAEWSEPLFNNRALFSDYYLNERLTQNDAWKKEDPAPIYRELGKMLAGVREKVAGKPEESIRKELLEPIFAVLGWTFDACKESKDAASEKLDYFLLAPDGKKIPCLAYTWDRSLDGPDENRDTDTPRENPAQSVVTILEKSGADATGWAIMTNGKTWRLYCARAHSRATNYFEIDLEETLASPDLADAFRYYWLLFRAASFAGAPNFVDSLLSESESYAKALGERLKERVFEHVFPRFAEGFVEQQEKPAAKLSEVELKEIFHATLTFLYRMLFLLYAEARDLLPVREARGYWEISLKKMKEEIAAKAGVIEDEAPDRLKKAFSATSTDLYDRLNALFRVIDLGDPDRNVPVYNGGLFITDPAAVEDESDEAGAVRFLAAHKIPDRFLALGLDLLARDIDEKSGSLAMIDYKSLGVRQLGSIYEGLLEFKLRVAPEKMAVVAGKKNEEVVPYAEAVKEGRRIKTRGKGAGRVEQIYHKGDPYLENDKHERKASGSYYTPDYIVKYIVQNTVGPALDSKCEALRPRLREAEKAYHAAVERRKAFEKLGQAGDDPEKTANTFRAVVDELFDLRVLDPAMGSGHFLVEAVDYLTDRMLAFLNAFPWNPVTAALRETRRTILEEMRTQGVNVDPARLTDVNLLKRHVLKRCIYGVDLNPMAVELAKVSLWLDCFTLGAPLSFLDHHLKCGNSLIGARIEEVRAALEMAGEREKLEIPLLVGVMGGSQFAGVMMSVDMMRHIGELSDVTAAQVRESRNEYRRAADALSPYKRILDVYTSRWFGNADTKLNQPAISFLRDEANLPWIQNPAKNNPRKGDSREIAENAVNAAREKRFFHWEIEFPEVFFGASKASHQQIVMKDNPGFEVVIGNPPWGGGLDRTTLTFLDATYKEVNDYESYQYFSHMAIMNMANKGKHSFIVPNTFVLNVLANLFRKWLLDMGSFGMLVDCSEVQLFDDPSVRCVIYFYERGLSAEILPIYQLNNSDGDQAKVTTWYLANRSEIIDGRSWTSLLRDARSIPNLTFIIEKKSIQLGSITRSKQGYIPYRLTSLATKFGEQEAKKIKIERAWHSMSKLDKSYLPELQGRDVRRYETDWSGVWVKYGEWVSSFVELEYFSTPRLLFREITDEAPHRLLATYETGIFIHNPSVLNACFKKTEYSHLYCLAVIGSSLLSEYYYRVSPKSDKGLFPKVLVEDIRKLPIRHITFISSREMREAKVEKMKTLVSARNEYALLEFVKCHLGAMPEESDVVHDLLALNAQRMIDMNLQKQTEKNRFVGWLEKLMKVGVEDLKGGVKIRNYLGDYQKSEPELAIGDLEDILYKNKGKLGISLSDARAIGRMRAEYEKSLAILRPIKSSLAWTDNLIDQIVYKLYGLTDEEIKVVEGK